jgi:hypothetical protein
LTQIVQCSFANVEFASAQEIVYAVGLTTVAPVQVITRGRPAVAVAPADPIELANAATKKAIASSQRALWILTFTSSPSCCSFGPRWPLAR